MFFWYIKVCILCKCIQYTKHWDRTQILNKFSSNKINGTKNAPFFSRVSTRHSFTFNVWFLYELKHKVRLSKTVCEIFHFLFRFAFVKVYINVHQNGWTLWLFDRVLLPDLWCLSCNKNFNIQWYLRELELLKNWPCDKFFKPRKSKFWERFSSNFK